MLKAKKIYWQHVQKSLLYWLTFFTSATNIHIWLDKDYKKGFYLSYWIKTVSENNINVYIFI